MRIQLALYRGLSWVSKVIRWFTWGAYSHVAVVHWQEDGSAVVYEAWQKGGVQKSVGFSGVHTKGTRIDLYSFRVPLTVTETKKIVAFLEGELGKPYDWRGVLSFVCRRRMQKRWAWFCSELAGAACMAGGRMLANCQPWKLSPEGVADSIVLKPDGNVTA